MYRWRLNYLSFDWLFSPHFFGILIPWVTCLQILVFNQPFAVCYLEAQSITKHPEHYNNIKLTALKAVNYIDLPIQSVFRRHYCTERDMVKITNHILLAADKRLCSLGVTLSDNSSTEDNIALTSSSSTNHQDRLYDVFACSWTFIVFCFQLFLNLSIYLSRSDIDNEEQNILGETGGTMTEAWRPSQNKCGYQHWPRIWQTD